MYYNVTFTERVVCAKNENYMIHQIVHTLNPELLSMDETFEKYRARRHEMWQMTHNRLDICLYVAILSKTTKNNVIWRRVHNLLILFADINIFMNENYLKQNFNQEKLHIIDLSGSGFANCADLGTLLG